MERKEKIEKMFEEMSIKWIEDYTETPFEKIISEPQEKIYYSITNNTNEKEDEENAQLARYQ